MAKKKPTSRQQDELNHKMSMIVAAVLAGLALIYTAVQYFRGDRQQVGIGLIFFGVFGFWAMSHRSKMSR